MLSVYLPACLAVRVSSCPCLCVREKSDQAHHWGVKSNLHINHKIVVQNTILRCTLIPDAYADTYMRIERTARCTACRPKTFSGLNRIEHFTATTFFTKIDRIQRERIIAIDALCGTNAVQYSAEQYSTVHDSTVRSRF